MATENIVLTKEEIENLTSLQKQQNDLVYGLGQVEYQLTYFTKQKNLIQQQLEALESNQTTTAQEIEKKIWARNSKFRKRRIC